MIVLSTLTLAWCGFTHQTYFYILQAMPSYNLH